MRRNMASMAAMAMAASVGVSGKQFEIDEEPIKRNSRSRRYALTPKQIKKRAAAKMAKKSRKINYNKNR